MAISYLGRAHIFMPASLQISASSSTVANVPWDRRHSLHHRHSSHRMHCSNHTVHRSVIYTSLHCNYSLPDNLTWKSSVGLPNSCERKMALTLDSTLYPVQYCQPAICKRQYQLVDVTYSFRMARLFSSYVIFEWLKVHNR